MMSNAKPRILLTGATGLIGSAVLKRVMQVQYPVLLLVRDIEKLAHITRSSDVSLASFDLTDMSDEAISAIRIFAPDVVIHCAWIGTTNRDRNLPEYVMPNIESSLRLFEITKQAGCRKWISIGSQDEYRQGLEDDITEDTPTDTISVYGNTKLSVYHALRALAGSHGIDFVWLRSFACYGKAYKPEFMIPYVIDCLKRNELPVMKTPHAVWDYFHVEDAARAILLCAEKSSGIDVFNLGSGKGVTVGEVALILAEQMHSPLRDALARQIAENTACVSRRVANVNKLSQAIGWSCEVPLHEGLRRCLS